MKCLITSLVRKGGNSGKERVSRRTKSKRRERRRPKTSSGSDGSTGFNDDDDDETLSPMNRKTVGGGPFSKFVSATAARPRAKREIAVFVLSIPIFKAAPELYPAF